MNIPTDRITRILRSLRRLRLFWYGILFALAVTGSGSAFVTLVLGGDVRTAVAHLCVAVLALSVVVASVFWRLNRYHLRPDRHEFPAIIQIVPDEAMDVMGGGFDPKFTEHMHRLIWQGRDGRVNPEPYRSTTQVAQPADLPDPDEDRPFGVRNDSGMS